MLPRVGEEWGGGLGAGAQCPCPSRPSHSNPLPPTLPPEATGSEVGLGPEEGQHTGQVQTLLPVLESEESGQLPLQPWAGGLMPLLSGGPYSC